MNDAWFEEARGIVPWPGAAVQYGTHPAAWGYVVTVDDKMVVVAWWAGGSSLDHPAPGDCVLLLSEPDTLAAFDRRLALRLGAPEDVVREGVSVYREEGTWRLRAGAVRNYPATTDEEAAVYILGGRDDTDDGLRTRVRAWKSVTP